MLSKLLPATLLSRVVDGDNRFRENCQNSWKENIRGACGLFDISGFSRLAARLSKQEKKEIDSLRQSTLGSVMEVDAPVNMSFKLKRRPSKVRRSSTIRALSSAVETIENEEELFRNASGMLGEELGGEGMGAEALAKFISDFFEVLVTKIHDSGGDIIKFAGDCLVCLWEYKDEPLDGSEGADGEGMKKLLYNAVRCGFQLKDCVSELKDAESLSVHICIGAGNMELVSLTALNRSEFVLLGDAYVEALTGIEASSRGQIVLSKGAYQILCATPSAAPLVGATIEGAKKGGNGASNLTREGSFTITEVQGIRTRRIELHEERLLVSLDCNILPPASALQPVVLQDQPYTSKLQAYCPQNLQNQSEVGLGSLRKITAVFVLFQNLESADLSTLDQVFKSIMSSVRGANASLKEFTVDDKGAVAVIVLGFPGAPHGNGELSASAIAMALDLRARTSAIGIRISVGIATGTGYCGLVGGKTRCNYGAVGSIVNLSARFMGVDVKMGGYIVVCNQTRNIRSVREQWRFRALPPLKLKGYDGTFVSAYIPVGICEIRDVLNPDHAAFIGREGVMKDLLQSCKTQEGLTVLNALEDGAGLSTVLSELAQRLVAENVLVCIGTSRSKVGDSSKSFSCLLSAIQMLFDDSHVDNHYYEMSKQVFQAECIFEGMSINRNLFQCSKDALATMELRRNRLRQLSSGTNTTSKGGETPKNANNPLKKEIDYVEQIPEASAGLIILKRLVPWLKMPEKENVSAGLNSISMHVMAKVVASRARKRVQKNLQTVQGKQINRQYSNRPRYNYEVERATQVAQTLQEVIKWKTQIMEKPFQRVVFLLDNVENFDYASLAVLYKLLEAKVPNLVVIAGAHESNVELLRRREQSKLSKYTVRKRKGSKRTESKDMKYFYEWTKQHKREEILKSVLNRRVHEVLLKPFTQEEIEAMILSRYGLKEIKPSVLTKLYGSGGTTPSAALEIVEDWANSGILQWGSNQNAHTLVWNSDEDVSLQTNLPTQIRKHNIQLFEDLNYHSQRMLELLSCFPGDVILKHIIMFDLQNRHFFSKSRTIKRTMSMQSPKSMGNRTNSFNFGNADFHNAKEPEPDFKVDQITQWMDDLEREHILEKEHGPSNTIYRFKRASMRRAIHDTMLFQRRQDIHKKIVQMFRKYPNDSAAQRLILFNAEKSGMYHEVFCFFWNNGVKAHKESNYEKGQFFFQQALYLVYHKPDAVKVVFTENVATLVDFPEQIVTLSALAHEVKKRLAVQFIAICDFDNAKNVVQDIIKFNDGQTEKTNRFLCCLAKGQQIKTGAHGVNRTWKRIFTMLKNVKKIGQAPSLDSQSFEIIKAIETQEGWRATNVAREGRHMTETC